jgi:adhesin transport system outer membrane protein
MLRECNDTAGTHWREIRACLRGLLLRFVVAAVGLISSSHAADTTVDLTLPQLQSEVAKVLARHPAIRSAHAERDGAGYRLSADEWGRYPSLVASTSKADNGDLIRTWEVRQPVWAGGRIDGAISASRARVDASTHRLAEVGRNLAEQLVLTAVDLALADAQIAIAADNVASLETLLHSIRRRTEGGLGLMSDVTLAQSRFELARSTLTQFRLSREQAASRWQSLTDQIAANHYVVAGIDPQPIGLSEALLAAKDSSPTLARLRAEMAAAQGDADVVRSRGWPQVSLRYQHNKQMGEFDQSEERTLAVIEFQPDAGLGVGDSVRAAEAAQESLRHQIAQVELEIEQSVRGVHAELFGLDAQITALNANIDAATEVIDSFIRQYNIGKRTWLDVLNAQREISDSKLQLANTQHRRVAAHYRLMILTGRFLNS